MMRAECAVVVRRDYRYPMQEVWDHAKLMFGKMGVINMLWIAEVQTEGYIGNLSLTALNAEAYWFGAEIEVTDGLDTGATPLVD